MIRPLIELEREAILHALELCQGNKYLASRELGIGKTTLYAKLRRFGVPRQRVHPPRPVHASLLLLQASALICSPRIFSNGHTPLATFLILPSTRAELDQANLKCPACKTRLLEGRK